MDCLYCFNEKYARVAAVSILSLIQHNENVRIHVFETDVTNETKCRFREWLIGFGVEIFFFSINDYIAYYKRNYKSPKAHAELFGRLVASDVLPENIKKVLYLDSDTLILSSLDVLVNLDLGDYYVAGVYDMSLPPLGIKESIGIEKDSIYINAGVTYINLEMWRKYNISDRFKQFSSTHLNARYFDQDILNAVCKERILLLPPAYNFTFIMSEVPYELAIKMMEPYTNKYYDKKEFECSQGCPCIIHFASELFGKPWFEDSIIRYVDEWRKLYAQTPWNKLQFSKRLYSNNRIISWYKRISESIIRAYYKKKDYRMVVFLYKNLYQRAHAFQRIIRG